MFDQDSRKPSYAEICQRIRDAPTQQPSADPHPLSSTAEDIKTSDSAERRCRESAPPPAKSTATTFPRETVKPHQSTGERASGGTIASFHQSWGPRLCFQDRTGMKLCQGCSKKQNKKKSLLSHGLCERTHRQTACHWNQGLQTKALVHKGSLNIFVVLSVALFFDYKIFCCFPRKMGLMNQHQLEINYLKTFVRAHLYFGDKTSSSAVGRKYWFLDSADPETLIFVFSFLF